MTAEGAVTELKATVREVLERNGALDKMRASMRAELIRAIDDRAGLTSPPVAEETYLIQELMREFLEYHGMRDTLSVFAPEAGLARQPLSREVAARRLHVTDRGHTKGMPLLYALVAEALAAKPPHRA